MSFETSRKSKKSFTMLQHPAHQGTHPRNDALAAHNRHRAQHGLQPLVLDDKLGKAAQKHADHLLSLGKNAKAEHSPEAKTYGENLALLPKFEYPIGSVVDTWYNEEAARYDWDFKNFQEGTGHMTQIIWKETRRLGVGYATAHKPDRTIIVFLYDPTGNAFHAFRQNIVPPKGYKSKKK